MSLWVLLLIGAVVLSLFVGVESLSLWEIFSLTDSQRNILMEVRIPRTVSLVIVGATMSVSGLLMQKLTQNRFVSPTTTGTIDSAQLGILFAVLFMSHSPSILRTVVAFIFSFVGTLFFVLMVQRLPGRQQLIVPLVGLMYGAVISAVVTLISYQTQTTQNITSWLQGNFSLINREDSQLLLVSLITLIGVYIFSQHFTLMGMGEEMTTALGAKYQRLMVIGVLLVALSSALSLAVVGNLPFIGLVIPNMVTHLWGDHLSKTQFLTAIIGAVFLVVCDIIARLIIYPYEMPVNIIVAVIGGISFIVILMRGGRQHAL